MMIIGGRAHSILKSDGADKTSSATVPHGRSEAQKERLESGKHEKQSRLRLASETAPSDAERERERDSPSGLQLLWSVNEHDETSQTGGAQRLTEDGEQQPEVEQPRMPFIVRQLLICLLYYVLLAIFCILGALATQAFELPAEALARHKESKYETKIYDFLLNHTNWSKQSPEFQNFSKLFQDYQHALTHAVKCGYDGDQTLWNFLNSVFYTTTIVTTIGYGQLAPRTVGGRIAMIVIAAFGIPLFLMNVTQLGRTFVYLLKMVKKYIRKRSIGQTEENEDDGAPQLPFYLAVIIITVYILFFSALLLITESWDFLEAVYFTFGTLATIGLGDVVPMNVGLLIGFSIFLIIGLSLVTMFLELTEAKMQQCLLIVKRQTGVAVKMGIQYRKERQATMLQWSKIAEMISQIHLNKDESNATPNTNTSQVSNETQSDVKPNGFSEAGVSQPQEGQPKEMLESINELDESEH